MSRGIGNTQKKILLLLFAGLALGFSGSPKTSFQIIKGIKEEWKEIDRQALKRSVKKLYESKLVAEKENRDGTITLILTNKGRQKALTYNLDEVEIKKPKQWDKKWRIVLFDIPEKIKKVREAVRMHLKNLGFYEFQKSVFVHPYDCQDEINYIVEFYDIRKFVRFIVAESLDNELHLKQYFNLL
ncbi:MAG: CRISPR-associated endonuclease Cas2 [Patescibacteria group bacterium]